MLEKMISLYVFLFARARFEKFNKLLFRLALCGLGVLNYKNSAVSGERALLKGFLPGKTGVLIDVGANQGGYTKEALGINSGLTTYAFEPHPKTFLRLSENLAGYENVIIVNKGLSSSSGTLKLYDYLNKDGSQHASLFEEVITEIHGSSDVVGHEVTLITLDDFVESEGIEEITLLKIDTEGNELEVLRGGKRILSAGKVKAIHFEFNEMNAVSRSFFIDFWKTLDKYQFYRLLPNDSLAIRHYTPLSCEIFAYQNVVAILRDR